MNSDKGIYNFRIFSDKLICGVSTKRIGPIKDNTGFNRKNLQRFADLLGINSSKLFFVKQIHGSDIYFVKDFTSNFLKVGDGLITNKKDIFLAILTADCMAVCFEDPVKSLVGIIHVGYKGLLNGIIGKTVSEFKKSGSDINDIKIAVGPSIGVCCYDIDNKRMEEFKAKLKKQAVFEEKQNKCFLDLKTTAVNILLSLGLKRSNIEVSPVCTKDSEKVFYSYRRDKDGLQRRFATVIGLK